MDVLPIHGLQVFNFTSIPSELAQPSLAIKISVSFSAEPHGTPGDPGNFE